MLREDVEDGEMSLRECVLLDHVEIGGRRVELVEAVLDEPAADEVREAYVAMRDAEGWTRVRCSRSTLWSPAAILA